MMLPGFNTASGNALLQLMLFMAEEKLQLFISSFNTASGNALLQQCPWKSAPGLG